MEYSPVACMRQSSRCCLSDSLGCLPRNFPLARAMAMPSRVRMRIEIGFELGEGGEDIEEHLSHRIARVVECPAEGQFHVSFPKPIGDGARIRDGPCQPVEFRHDQRVAFAHGGEGLVEAGAGAGRAGEAAIGVDAILGDAQLQERQALGGQILPFGGTARVSNERCRHGGKCTDRVPLPQYFSYHSYETPLAPIWRGSGRQTAPSAGRSTYGQRCACRDERITERWNMPRRSIWSARQRAALFDLPTDEAALLAITRCPTTTSSISGCGAGDTTGWASRSSFAPFDIRGGFWWRGGHSPERPSLHCRTARHARRRPRWLCGAGGDTEGTPRRDPAHLRLQDVLGALRPGPEGLARERGGSGALE